ncbi:MAG: hypothetical protein DRQ41_12640 [Gammaproteobacteria bacterium]|nr:MAG: hypothetical protein DRQ41_12640 [Gammaproteobacteria bacterium]
MMREMHILFRRRLYEEATLLLPEQIEYLIQSYGDPFTADSQLLDWYAHKIEEFHKLNEKVVEDELVT